MTTLLLVEDDARIREAPHRSLAAERYRGQAAATGEQALDPPATAAGPDVVLLDPMPPGSAGLEVCARIRALLTHVVTVRGGGHRAGQP